MQVIQHRQLIDVHVLESATRVRLLYGIQHLAIAVRVSWLLQLVRSLVRHHVFSFPAKAFLNLRAFGHLIILFQYVIIISIHLARAQWLIFASSGHWLITCINEWIVFNYLSSGFCNFGHPWIVMIVGAKACLALSMEALTLKLFLLDWVTGKYVGLIILPIKRQIIVLTCIVFPCFRHRFLPEWKVKFATGGMLLSVYI